MLVVLIRKVWRLSGRQPRSNFYAGSQPYEIEIIYLNRQGLENDLVAVASHSLRSVDGD